MLSKNTKRLQALGSFRSVYFIIPLVIIALITVVTFADRAYCAGEQAPTGPDVQQLREKWGIEPVSLRLTAAGYMVDFRYRVTDPKKAEPFFYARSKPVLIDQASGKKLSVPVAPKVGALRQKTNKPEVSRIYFVLFGNSGVVKAGNKVTLIIGDIRIEDLTVEGELPPPAPQGQGGQ